MQKECRKMVLREVIIVYLMVYCCATGMSQDVPEADTLELIPGFGGPGSVPGQLNRDRKLEKTILQPYFDFKTRLEQNSGFAYSIDFFPIVQAVSGGVANSVEARGVFSAYFYYALLGRGTSHTGALVFKVDNRHGLGTDILEDGLGTIIDYPGYIADPQGNMPWALSNLYWEQNFLDYRITILAGLLDASDYTNVYALMDPWSDFFNLAFSSDLTIPIPDPGLGLALFAQLSDHFYILGSLTDANGNPAKPQESFSSFFGDAEYFSSFELGWFKSLAKAYSDNIHITFWHAAQRSREMVPGGWGLAFSANCLLGERWSPFLRAGYAMEGGAFWEQSISVGCGYHVSEIINQLGLGLNWGHPATPLTASNKENQFAAEIYGRFNLWKVFSLTPDFQLLFYPAPDAGLDVNAVFGLRGRVSL